MDTVQREIITEVSRDLVRQLAPHELPLFQPVSKAYFKNPKDALKGRTGKGGLLAFGATEAVLLLTPLALNVMTEVVAGLSVEVVKSTGAVGSSSEGESLKRLFRRFRSGSDRLPEQPVSLLTPQQLARVRAITTEQARRYGYPDAQAGQLADSVVATLAVGTA